MQRNCRLNAWPIGASRPFAEGLKAAHAPVPLVVGWGFHFFESNWTAWELLHRPTLDALQPWLDGYGEHHYGVDPRRVAASYEIADAYMRSRWGRRIGFWNTEACGMQDPERPDVIQGLPHGHAIAETRGACAYFLRDVLTLLHKVPDKARLRCAHEPQVNDGVPMGFRLLKTLRGKLVETGGDDDGVWVVAARAPGRLTAVCFNDTTDRCVRPVTVQAPAGGCFERLKRRRIVARAERLVLEETETALGAETTWCGQTELGSREAEVLEFTVAGHVQPDVVRREQFVADAILQEVAAGKPAHFNVKVPAAARHSARRAHVRWVIAGADAPLRVRCGALNLAVPDGHGPFREVEVPLTALGDVTELGFQQSGWESTVVGAASIILETVS
jgi:hypothetical protein